jgi:hypothetical protein
MSLHITISAIALLFCALLGLGSLLSPRWAAGIVRLKADPDPDKPGGFSEFRATYGGLLLMLHATALLILIQPDLALGYKVFAIFPLAAGWMGAGLGRTASLLLDRDDNRAPGMIPVWIPLELALGLAIGAPFLQLGAG